MFLLLSNKFAERRILLKEREKKLWEAVLRARKLLDSIRRELNNAQRCSRENFKANEKLDKICNLYVVILEKWSIESGEKILRHR